MENVWQMHGFCKIHSSVRGVIFCLGNSKWFCRIFRSVSSLLKLSTEDISIPNIVVIFLCVILSHVTNHS